MVAWLEHAAVLATFVHIQLEIQSEGDLGQSAMYANLARLVPNLLLIAMTLLTWRRFRWGASPNPVHADRCFHTAMGLALSLVGDVLLPLGTKIGDLFGVMCYLIGIACFIFAHNKTVGIRLWGSSALPFFVAAIGGYLVIQSRIRQGMEVLMFCYVMVLAMCLWRSIARFIAEGNQYGALRAVLAAVLRVGADSVLIANLFRIGMFEYKNYAITVYLTSQFLVATSVNFGGLPAVDEEPSGFGEAEMREEERLVEKQLAREARAAKPKKKKSKQT